MVGVIIKSDDYQDLYVASSLVASLVLRGDEVNVFITGRAVNAFVAGRSAVNVVDEMRMRGMDYLQILRQVKDMGKLKLTVCVGMIEALGVDRASLDPIIDDVATFTDFTFNNDNIIVT